jgi:hypothetical protein
VLDLKRKVAWQQRQIGKLQRAAGLARDDADGSTTWPHASAPDSI